VGSVIQFGVRENSRFESGHVLNGPLPSFAIHIHLRVRRSVARGDHRDFRSEYLPVLFQRVFRDGTADGAGVSSLPEVPLTTFYVVCYREGAAI